MYHTGLDAKPDPRGVEELSKKHYQFFGLTLASRNLQSEFYPIFMSQTNITVKLSQLLTFLSTFYHNADASTRGALTIDLDGMTAPVDILPLIRLNNIAPGVSWKFSSETIKTDDLLDSLKRTDASFWNSLLGRAGAGAYLAMYAGCHIYVKKGLDDRSFGLDLAMGGMYWWGHNTGCSFYGDS